MVVDNSLTDSLYNSNRVLNAETLMMMKEARRRRVRRDQVPRWQRLFRRLDPAEHGGVDLPGAARRHPAFLRLPRLDQPRPRGHRLRAARERLRPTRLVGADVGAHASTDQRQEGRRSTVTSITVAASQWNNAFGFNNKPGNYVPVLVIDQTTGALAPVGAPRNNCLLPAAAGLRPGDQPERHALRRPDLATGGVGAPPRASRPAAHAPARPATKWASSTGCGALRPARSRPRSS
jgi:hypothetical protein